MVRLLRRESACRWEHGGRDQDDRSPTSVGAPAHPGAGPFARTGRRPCEWCGGGGPGARVVRRAGDDAVDHLPVPRQRAGRRAARHGGAVAAGPRSRAGPRRHALRRPRPGGHLAAAPARVARVAAAPGGTRRHGRRGGGGEGRRRRLRGHRGCRGHRGIQGRGTAAGRRPYGVDGRRPRLPGRRPARRAVRRRMVCCARRGCGRGCTCRWSPPWWREWVCGRRTAVRAVRCGGCCGSCRWACGCCSTARTGARVSPPGPWRPEWRCFSGAARWWWRCRWWCTARRHRRRCSG